MRHGDDVRIKVVTTGNLSVLDHVADDVFDNVIEIGRARACVRSPDYRLIVAMAGNLVIGQVRGFLQRQPDDDAWLYIDNLGVNEQWRRRAIARLLVERLIRWGRQKGAALVWLGSAPHNEEAMHFYRALGFNAEPMVSWSKPLDLPHGR
jgi:ribosomal protein S18 acetylase RimI-like enzyme